MSAQHLPGALYCPCADCIEQRGISDRIRRATPTERHICPTCKRPTLTPWEKARGYQCRSCTAHDES